MAMDSFAVFCHNIAGLRAHRGYSKKHMAQLLGIGVGSLNKIECGMLPPRLTVDVLFAVYGHFHIRPSVLLSQEIFPLPQKNGIHSQ